MSDEMREMTLEEYLRKLPPNHRAIREWQDLFDAADRESDAEQALPAGYEVDAEHSLAERVKALAEIAQKVKRHNDVLVDMCIGHLESPIPSPGCHMCELEEMRERVVAEADGWSAREDAIGWERRCGKKEGEVDALRAENAELRGSNEEAWADRDTYAGEVDKLVVENARLRERVAELERQLDDRGRDEAADMMGLGPPMR